MSGAKNDVFNEVEQETKIEYESTDFTRFGFWRRLETDHADKKRAASANEVGGLGVAFAYSPLKQTTYVDGDPNYPAGVEGMTYSGKTLAYDAGRAKTYEGSVEVSVDWEAYTPGTMSTVTVKISDLITKDLGEPILLYDATANSVNNKRPLRSITFIEKFDPTLGLAFSAGDNDAFMATNGEAVNLGTDRGSVEIDSVDSTNDPQAFLTGMFVGKNADGPTGVLGRWGISDLQRWDPTKLTEAAIADGKFAKDADLIGAFGADLVQ